MQLSFVLIMNFSTKKKATIFVCAQVIIEFFTRIYEIKSSMWDKALFRETNLL